MRWLPALVAALALAGCGGGEAAERDVVNAIEEAAGVDLKRGKPPGDEVERVYSAGGSGLIQVFVLPEPGDAELMEEAAPPAEGVRTVRHENVFVVVGGPKAAVVVDAVRGLQAAQ